MKCGITILGHRDTGAEGVREVHKKCTRGAQEVHEMCTHGHYISF